MSTVFLLPPPAIEVLASDWSLVLESENAEVDIIRSAYVDTRQQLVCIQKEAVTMLCMLGAGQSSALLQPMRPRLDSRGSGKFYSTELKVRFWGVGGVVHHVLCCARLQDAPMPHTANNDAHWLNM